MVLPPFEQQVFQALGAAMEYYSEDTIQTLADTRDVRIFGQARFGQHWGGYTTTRKHPINAEGIYRSVTHTQINLALGRLAKKGLAERVEWAWLNQYGAHVGRWKLTELGRAIFGLPSTLGTPAE